MPRDPPPPPPPPAKLTSRPPRSIAKPTPVRPGVSLGFHPLSHDGKRRHAIVPSGVARAASPRAVQCVVEALAQLTVREATQNLRERYTPRVAQEA